jgi:hypothetical protein
MRACDVVLDPSFGSVNGTLSNKIVFLNPDYFEQALPMISRYSNVTLVVHHSDKFFDRIMFEAVRSSVSHVYARNCDFLHPMITQIPIGFVDSPPFPGPHMTKTRVDEAALKKFRDLEIEKDIDVYTNVSIHGNEPKFVPVNALREACLKVFPNSEKLPFEKFMIMLRRAKYVPCPMGFGIDTHRFYEAAYMKARPVVITSCLDDMYRKFGAVILQSWTDPLPEWTDPNVPEELFHTGFWIMS